MKNKEKMNNKGFSLVELIIVIAIMVILVGVLAPVYTRYVESTRKSADVDAVASIANAMETVLIDNDARGTSDLVITATFTGGSLSWGVTSANAAAQTQATTELNAIISAYTLRGTWSSAAGALTANLSSGNVTYQDTTPTGVYTDIMTYSPALNTRLSR